MMITYRVAGRDIEDADEAGRYAQQCANEFGRPVKIFWVAGNGFGTDAVVKPESFEGTPTDRHPTSR